MTSAIPTFIPPSPTPTFTSTTTISEAAGTISTPTHTPPSSPPFPQTPPFDPLIALLDEQWLRLDLSHSPQPPRQPPSPPPPRTIKSNNNNNNLIALAASAANLSAAAAAWDTDFAEAERQLRSALADADAADSLTARTQADATVARRALLDAQARVDLLADNQQRAKIELVALHECIATLHQAHQLDASISALVIDDQADEIRELRHKVDALQTEARAVRSALCKASFALKRQSNMPSSRRNMTHPDGGSGVDSDRVDETRSLPKFETPKKGMDVTVSTVALSKHAHLQPDMDGSTASDDSGGDGGDGGENEMQSDFKHPVFGSTESETSFRLAARRMSARNPSRRLQLESLQRSKNDLFHSFERRHSTTIQNVVRQTSQLSLGTSQTDVSTVIADTPVLRE